MRSIRIHNLTTLLATLQPRSAASIDPVKRA